MDGDPDTVGTAVAARSLASAIPGALGGTPSCWRNASVRPCRAGRSLYVARSAFIAGNTKLLPRPQQRAENTHKRIMPCRLLQRLVGSAFDVRRPLLQRRRLVRQVLEHGNRQARRWASGNVSWPGGPRTPHSRGRLASAILSRSLSMPAELIVGDHRIPECSPASSPQGAGGMPAPKCTR